MFISKKLMRKTEKKKTVSAVVPVFNEEKTVGKVVEALLNCDLITEVICVNDGSEDKSLEVLKSFGGKIKLINLKRNSGKGAAMASGVKEARGEIVAFFDSDLDNLSSKHIKTLLDPILKGEAQVVLGYPTRRKDASNIFAYLTGERAYFRNRLLPHLDRLAKTKRGAETFLNSLFRRDEMMVIPLTGLIHLQKYEKLKFSEALRDYLAEAVEIAQEIGRKEVLSREDYQKIMSFAKVKTFKGLKTKINEVKNKKVKELLNRYVLKYMALAKKKLQDLL